MHSSDKSRVRHYFEVISKIPRCSGDRDGIATYLIDFADTHGFESVRDETDNVIIYKPASSGKENAAYVALQGHTDMVCEKSSCSVHDFSEDPIELIAEGDTLRANGTTMGGDNGIAVAMMLAVLEDQTLVHPPLEMIFTSDEEIGLIGAKELDVSGLRSMRLINLDSEEEGVLLTGCAGGETMEFSISAKRIPVTDVNIVQIAVSGLLGGHSGMEIHRKRYNAIKVLTEVLNRLKDEMPIGLLEISGGSKHNAIPREAQAALVFPEAEKAELQDHLDAIISELEEVYRLKSYEDMPKIRYAFIQEETVEAFASETFENVLACLTLMPTGVYSMSSQIDGMVQTSDNLAIVETRDDEIAVITSVRSSDTSDWAKLKERIIAVAGISNATCIPSEGYPAWEIKEYSALRDTFSTVHKRLYGKSMQISAIHAGLECALFANRNPSMDLVSLGPDMYEVHTPAEHLSLSSVERVYSLLTATLSQLS